MRKRLTNLISQNEFAKNAIVVVLGTGVAQVLPLLFYPFLSRIFSPDDFGLFATLTAITAIISVLATGKYESSILIAKTKKDAINIVCLVLVLSFTFLLISFVFFGILSKHIGVWFKNPLISKWILITPLAAFSIIIYKLYNEWCVRNKYFRSLSYSKITNAGFTTLGNVAVGVTKLVNNGLFLGDTIGRIVTSIFCLFGFYKADKQMIKEISLKRMRALAKEYIDFPKYSLPEGLIDTINSNLSIFMITTFFLTAEVGYFSMANTVLSIPASIISLAVMDVFRQKANDEWQQYGNCINIYKKTVKFMLAIVLPGSVLCFFILPDLFSFVLGTKWRIAGEYAQILLPNISVLFVFQVVSAVFIIANKMKFSLYWQIFSISLTVISLLLGGLIFRDLKQTLVLYVIARIIANLSRFYLTFKYAKNIKL